jgi:hypothetical protein
MAIAAKQLKVLEPIVCSIAVDVMKLHAQRLPPPFGDPAYLTAVLLQSFAEKPRLQMPTASLTTGNKELIDRVIHSRGTTAPRFTAFVQVAWAKPKRSLHSRTESPVSTAAWISSQS